MDILVGKISSVEASEKIDSRLRKAEKENMIEAKMLNIRPPRKVEPSLLKGKNAEVIMVIKTLATDALWYCLSLKAIKYQKRLNRETTGCSYAFLKKIHSLPSPLYLNLNRAVQIIT